MESERSIALPEIKKVDSKEFLELINNGNDYQIVDVNEQALDFKLSGNVLHIPFSKLDEQQKKLDKDKALILICKFGEKSFFAAALLQQNYGFRNLVSLTGGMETLNKLLDEKKPEVRR
ncbi:MAG: rhodanese-like domain-containing protein [Bacteroidota bacterium]|nr:rhodanese-like domain-containing protein [Bacteroidota bacterium]